MVLLLVIVVFLFTYNFILFFLKSQNIYEKPTRCNKGVRKNVEYNEYFCQPSHTRLNDEIFSQGVKEMYATKREV